MTSPAPPLPTQSDTPNQFKLLTQRRFAPYFWTQFLGAGNDNLFKFAFTVLVTYQLQIEWLPPNLAGTVIGGCFIAPFMLFSATSGQLTDKFEKTLIIRGVKTLEIGIMLVGAIGLIWPNITVLLACIFLMGLHSTLFGPVKFAYLPQHLNERELTGGVGMVEMGTFVAILLGNVAGGLLIAIPDVGPQAVSLACLGVAVLGRLCAQGVPMSPPTDPGLQINWNPWSETWRNLRWAYDNKVVFRSMLGISWMWFLGAIFLSNFPAFAKEALHGDAQVASLLLAVFSVGIGTGSLACEMLSRRHVEIGLVPLGAIGMTVFTVDLYFSSRGLPPVPLQNMLAFMQSAQHWRIIIDLALLAAFAGIYSVPMYALIQLRTPNTHRARMIATNNILNAIFMVVSAVLGGTLISSGFSVPELFLIIGLANMLVASYVFLLVPEYLLRFVAFFVARLIYRFRVEGGQHIPTHGAAIMACNHVSFIDPLLLMAASPRPIRFLMDHRIYNTRGLRWFFRLAKAIPVAQANQDWAVYEQAFIEARAVLEEGDLIGIFPEGSITRDGQLQDFKGGVIKLLSTTSVPVIPIGLSHLWGSFFSRAEGTAMRTPFRRGIFNRVHLRAGPPMAAHTVTTDGLQRKVAQLLDP